MTNTVIGLLAVLGLAVVGISTLTLILLVED
jgi:hypothetical protein